MGEITIIILTGIVLLLLFIIYKLHKMSAETEAIKAKLLAQGTALTAITTNVSGIQGDIAALKQKIQDLIDAEDGATPEELAELSLLVDDVSANIDVIGTTTASLDAETDPANP